MSSRFVNHTSFELVDDAINKVDELLAHGSKLHTLMLNRQEAFQYGLHKKSLEQVFNLLLTTNNRVEIHLYIPTKKTSEIGGWDGKKIRLNVHYITQCIEDGEQGLMNLVGTILHEWSHACGMNHGTGWFRNFRTKHKSRYSVPYYISDNTRELT